MVSDCRILGIEETDDPQKIKAAYRRRIKELHPDLAKPEDALRNHYLFISVCQAYQRLLSASKEKKDPVTAKVSRGGGEAAISVHADPAYAFYRQGMKAFMAIHPSAWNMDNRRMLATQIAGEDTTEQEEIRKRILELTKLFPKAYYYFSIVVHEYPESAWAPDAREKMTKVEDRIEMYRKIIDSFTAWNRDRQEEVRRYNELYNRMNSVEKMVRKDMPKDWDR
jgi:hypothetical protein